MEWSMNYGSHSRKKGKMGYMGTILEEQIDLEDVIEDPGGWSDVFPDIVISVGIVSDF